MSGPGRDIFSDIFISYGREDGVKEFAKQLYTNLKQNGFTVWLDVECIPVGSSFPDEIGRALNHCKALIAIMTKKYVCESDYCKKELYTAVERKMAVFPVVYENSSLWRDSDEGAGVCYMTRGLNWTMFRPGEDDYSTSLEKLIIALRGVMMTVDEVEERREVVVQQESCVMKKDSRIKMSQLDSIKAKDGTKIKIIESLSNSWKKFGNRLDFDPNGSVVNLIGKNERGQTEDCLREVLSRWLDGKGRQPATWKHLIEIIDDCDHGYLASQIQGLF